MKIGKYEILRPIAKGGMAEIFLAQAIGIEGFEKLVVIKRMLPQLATQPEFVRMFLDEARIAATLHHSNIVQVFDIGESDEGYFFAMEYLHGEDLQCIEQAAKARKKPVPMEHAISIVMGICAGLHYAHEKRGLDGEPLHVVHRDVSPHNVFVTYDGGVKLVDFGIAKAASRAETRSGTLKGKIPYMSPEQCRCDPLDRRSDLFAIGIVLWELTTGRRLFGGHNDFLTLKTIVETDAQAPSRFIADYPRELERVVQKALRRDPAARYQTAEELQLALEEVARERRMATSPVGLARYLRELFDEKVLAWSAARSEGSRALAYHVMASLDREAAQGKRDDDDGREDEDGGEAPATRELTQHSSLPSPSVGSRWRRAALASGVALAVALACVAGALKLRRAGVAQPPRVVAAPAPSPAVNATELVEAPVPPASPVSEVRPPPPPRAMAKLPRAKARGKSPHPQHPKKAPVDLDAALPP